MNNLKKKLFSLLLSLSVLCTALPGFTLTAHAAPTLIADVVRVSDQRVDITLTSSTSSGTVYYLRYISPQSSAPSDGKVERDGTSVAGSFTASDGGYILVHTVAPPRAVVSAIHVFRPL